MSETYIIQKLIIEFDLNSKEEYHELVGYLEANLYRALLEEIEGVLTDVFKDTKEDLVIEKLEIELDPVPYFELKSPQLITQIKSNLKSQLDTFDWIGENKIDKVPPEEKSITKDELHKRSLEQQLPERSQEQRFKSRALSVSKLQSIQNYLLTGQFILGVELTPIEFVEYFREEQKKTQLINWIIGIPSKTRQYIVLQRISFQIPLPQKKAFFLDTKIQNLNQSFNIPLPLSDENIAEKKVPPESRKQGYDSNIKSSNEDTPQDVKSIIKSKGRETLEPLKQDSTPKVEPPKENSQNVKSINKPDKRDTPGPQRQDSNSKIEPPKEAVHNLLNTREGFYIPNAGIVIIAPYLPALFQKGELLNENLKAFKNKESIYYAIHLLEFLVTKKEIITENTTVLYKLLCGLTMAAPIKTQIKLEEEHKQMANRLLLQVSKKWDIKIGEQIDMLRGSFFIRDGKLVELNDYWLLTVETKIYDKHLFKKLPWSFNRIKLPWMSKWLRVDWY